MSKLLPKVVHTSSSQFLMTKFGVSRLSTCDTTWITNYANIYIYNNTVWSVYILELVSFSLYLLVLSRYINLHFWPDCELIPTGNTILKCQQRDILVLTTWYYLKICLKVTVHSCTAMFLSAQCLLFPSATIQ
jgi:hypothetical protein